MKVPLVLLLLQLTATWSTLIMRIRSVSKEAPRIEIVPAATPSATFKMMKMVMNTASTIRGMTWRRAAARGSGNERGEQLGPAPQRLMAEQRRGAVVGRLCRCNPVWARCGAPRRETHLFHESHK